MKKETNVDRPALRANRYVVAKHVSRFDLAAVRRDLLCAGLSVQGDFRTLATALPAVAKTTFGVYDDGKQILVAVCMRDLSGVKETIEVLFNPQNDGIGYQQFLVTPLGVTGPYHFAPYPCAHSSAYRHMTLVKWQWEPQDFSNPADESGAAGHQAVAMAWVFAWFDAAEVFSQGAVAGFNLARTTGKIPENSTWNPCSGSGMPDATSFGKLYRKQPVDWATEAHVTRTAEGLHIRGCCSSTRPLRFTLVDPLGQTVPLVSNNQSEGDWHLLAPATSSSGRYRLYAEQAEATCEPRYLAFDVSPSVGAPYAVTMTYDIPDDILCNPVPYTPAVLEAELDMMRNHGINRIHWIDYPPETLYAKEWVVRSPNADLTRKACGDILPLAAQAAKRRGMRFIGIFKPFDIAMDGTFWHPERVDAAVPGHAVRNFEGRDAWVPAAVAAHQDCILQENSDWFSEGGETLPTGFRLYSRDPLDALQAQDVRIWTSTDNRRYRLYRGAMQIRTQRMQRPHQCWTAAGNQPEATQETVYALEVDGLRLRSPYLALEIRSDASLVGRAHAFAEAWDANGNSVPVTLATRGDSKIGFSYWQEWIGWANTSPRMVEDVRWGKGLHGMAFARKRTCPTLFEPCCEGSREIWLQHVARILETEADGVGIRTLCHHNNVMDYLTLSFAPAVRERFRSEHGRDPQATWADATLIRELRGRAYTDFLRQAKALATKAGKTLALYLETGIEVPASLDQRMQMNLEWETWIREGIADELVLKWWFSQNPFIHERVLPLARKHGIPVHLVEMNGSLRTPRAIERASALVRESRLAGFAGSVWYEAADYKRLNTESVPEFRMHAGDAIRLSANTIQGELNK